MSELAKFERGVRTLSDRVTTHMRPVEKDDLPFKDVYHISTNPNIPVFIPMVSARTIEGEDVRVPRICVGISLITCFFGYGKRAFLWDDFYSEDPKDSSWTIYGFDFKLAVRPLPRLLPGQKDTKEHWLISYSPDTAEYKSTKLGKIDLVAYQTRRMGNKRINALEFVIQVKDKDLLLHKDIVLSKGEHWVTVSNWVNDDYDLNALSFEHRAIEKEEYEKLVAGKVSHLAPVAPASASW